MEPDESAVDFSAADFASDGAGPMSSTFSVQKSNDKEENPKSDLDKTSGIRTNTDIDDSYNDTTVMDQTVDKTVSKTINKTVDMTAGCGTQGDMDYTNDETAMEVSTAEADDSEVTMNFDKTGGVGCGKTFNADQTEDVTMDETNGDDVIDDVNKTEDDHNQTTGIGCGATFNVTNDVTKDATTLDETDDTAIQPEMQPMPKPSLPKPVLEAVVISSDDESEVKTADDSEVVCIGEANDSVDIYAEDPEDCEDGTEEFDTAIEENQTPPPPVVDISEPTPRKGENDSDKMPTPDFGPKKVILFL